MFYNSTKKEIKIAQMIITIKTVEPISIWGLSGLVYMDDFISSSFVDKAASHPTRFLDVKKMIDRQNFTNKYIIALAQNIIL